MKIKIKDNVKIIVGKDSGKSGQVEYVDKHLKKITVKGIHILKKHIKPSQQNPRGGIIDINKKICVSNVMIICPSCGKPTRIGYQIVKNNKIRICKKCHQSLETERKK